MKSADPHPMVERLTRLVALDVAQADRDICRQALADFATVRRFLQGFESRVAYRLKEVSPTPESDTAHSTGSTGREAAQSQNRGTGRHESGPAGEALGEGMDEGLLSGAHLDTYLRVRDTLKPELREEFSNYADDIAGWAGVFHVDLFARRLRALADEIRDRHGVRLLDEQKRQNSLRTWVDRHTGMFRIAGEFDPESAVLFRGRLEAMVRTLFSEATPDTCPDNSVAKQNHLRALALLALTEHGPSCAGGAGRTEVLIVADTTQRTARGEPVVDWGLPVELPLHVLETFFARAGRLSIVDLHRQGKVIDHTGRLNLGRETRLANRAQRRVLRARHSTCVVPTCQVPFDRCDIHHIRWWRQGGATDLANLAPVCSSHHSKIHGDGWVLHVDEDGQIAVILPNGHLLTEQGWVEVANGPPPRAPVGSGFKNAASSAAYAASVPTQEDVRDGI